MTVQEVKDQLVSAEFKQLSLDAIADSDILSYINLGVLELYKRFKLKTSEYIVDLEDNETMYELPTDCMRVLEVYNELGQLHELNDEDDALSILTPTWNQIQVPNPATGGSLSIIYASTPTYVTTLNDEVGIPYSLLEALLFFCAYRALMPIDEELSDKFYAKFINSCNTAKAFGLITLDDVNFKFSTQDKGFV